MRERYVDPDPAGAWRDRWIAVVGVMLVHAAIGWALLVGLAPGLMRQTGDSLATFDLKPPPPPPPAVPPLKAVRDVRRNGAAAPANRDARPSEVVAPVVPPPPVPPPLYAAPIAGVDSAPASGAAPSPGAGTGGGGAGQGTGSGGSGTGQGVGGRGTFAYKVSGRIHDRDYPKSAARAGIGGTVWVRYTVTVKGRAEDCRVTRGSGNADLDAVTCRLVTKRFRYRPGTDAAGRAIASVIEEDHNWLIEPDDGRQEGAANDDR